jgi:hypothetical protein
MQQKFRGLCAMAGLTACTRLRCDGESVMGNASCDSRLWNVGRKGVGYASFAPTLLLTCYAGFAAEVTAPPQPLNARVYMVPSDNYYYYPAQAGGTLALTSPPPQLDGLGFGAGVALTFGQSRVSNATVVNNIVRATEEGNVMAGLVFESHYFFVQPPTKLFGSMTNITWGHGPFVAVDVSTSPTTTNSNFVAGFSLGWMVGFRRISDPVPALLDNNKIMVAQTDKNSWNIGVGFRVDPKATVLGDGIVANMPLPAGENPNMVRTMTAPRYGVMLLTSFSFN